MRRQRLLGTGAWRRWRGLAVVLGVVGLIVGFVERGGLVPTLLALALILIWYLYRQR
ncbi:MAG: hypothetical protein FWJ62_08490 [Thermaerobacter sp.]